MKFSVTIPAYKSRFLKEAIESVVNQTYADWELIVVDDCSPEDLAAVVAPYLADPRVSYHRNERNCGAVNLVDNWNICLGYCTGDYVVCMGDDDRLLPCCLQEYAELASRHPGLAVYHARTEIIDEHGTLVNLQEPRPEWESALSLIWNRWSNRSRQYIGDFCYDVAQLRANGGYYQLPLAWGTDDICAARAAVGKGIANTQAFCFQYRENSFTITSSRANAKQKLLATRSQYDWFGELLTQLAEAPLSAADRRYLQTIETPRRQHYFLSFDRDCVNYIHGSPWRLAWCRRLLKPLGYDWKIYLKWYVKSLFR